MKTISDMEKEIKELKKNAALLKKQRINRVKKGKMIEFFAIPHTRDFLNTIYECNNILENMVKKEHLNKFACNKIVDDFWDQCSTVQFFINENYFEIAKDKIKHLIPENCFGKYEVATYENAGNGNPNYLSRNR